MWIFCCGMHRAGSTVQYLLTKEIVESTGNGKAIGFGKKAFKEIYQQNKSQDDYIVVKTHRLFPEILPLFERKEAAAIYVYRDMRDAVLSRIKKNGNNKFNYGRVLKRIHMNIQTYYQWQGVSPIMVSRYEDMVTNLEQEALRIGRFLGMEISEDKASELARKYSLEEQKKRIASIDYQGNNIQRKKSGVYIDLETQLHNNHISSGTSEQWKIEFTPLQVAFIEEHAYDWLVSLNYPISQSWLKRKYSVLSSKKKKCSMINQSRLIQKK